MQVGNAKWSCPHCPKAMKRQNDLQKHIMIHTGEKPFKCDMCDYASNRKTNLQRHKRFKCVMTSKADLDIL